MAAIYIGVTWRGKHAAGCGMTLEQIKAELFGRDLGKKSNRRHQVEYAERTAERALRSV
jgi:hypothetical protein